MNHITLIVNRNSNLKIVYVVAVRDVHRCFSCLILDGVFNLHRFTHTDSAQPRRAFMQPSECVAHIGRENDMQRAYLLFIFLVCIHIDDFEIKLKGTNSYFSSRRSYKYDYMHDCVPHDQKMT